MHRKRCCFAGHSKIYCEDMLREKILSSAEKLITQHDVKEILVGNYGDFDRCATGVVKELKKKYNVKLVLIIPYMTKEIVENRDYYNRIYDEICLATISDNVPFKCRILYANRYMVDCCEYLIAYVNSSWGGASKTLEYAIHKNRNIINLAIKKG